MSDFRTELYDEPNLTPPTFHCPECKRDLYLTSWDSWDWDLLANVQLVTKELQHVGHLMGITKRQNPPQRTTVCEQCWHRIWYELATEETLAKVLGDSEEDEWMATNKYPNKYTPEEHRG